MIDEEKAEEYSDNLDLVKERNPELKTNDDFIKQAYKDGLAEGRKEKCLEQNNDGTIRPCEVMKKNEELKATYKKQRNKRIDQLQKENVGLKKENAELKEQISTLLSCSNCPDNKGGYVCEKEYNDKCLAQKIQYIKELKEEIEKMKCCGNCKHSFSNDIGCMQRARNKHCDNLKLWEPVK